jgi:hypothetical protein
MKTYLIFFGKSQYFTTHAFDNDDYIDDFNTVIKDFDLLESKIFTVDAIDNKEMFAKYHFSSREGKKYSLIKLYSFAQAFSGDRVAGSIYGVALLSENDIALNKTNFNILSNAKSSFAKLCLNGYKFKSSDFYDEVYKIWGALINHNEGNYLDKVVFSNRKISNINLDVKGFYLKNMFEDAVSLENQMNTASRIYMSEDLEHLKRTNLKWGNDFKIYTKTVSGYEIYQEPKPVVVSEPKTSTISNQNSTISEEQKLKIKVSDQEQEILELEESLISEQKRHKKSILYTGVLISILFLTTVTFFFTGDFISSKKDTPNPFPEIDTIENPQPGSVSTISIDAILDNPSNLDSIIAISKDIKFITSFNAKLNYKDSLQLLKKFNAIQSKAVFLKTDVTKIEELYYQKKSEIDVIVAASNSKAELISKEKVSPTIPSSKVKDNSSVNKNTVKKRKKDSIKVKSSNE